MTPRSTAFGLILLIAVICGTGLLLLRGTFWEETEDLDPRTTSRSTDDVRDGREDGPREDEPTI